MAARRRESGEARQERIKRMQHRPEQNRGYDEAVRGGSGAADDRSARDVPTTADSTAESRNDAHDREAELARQQVRQHDRSASRPATREP